MIFYYNMVFIDVFLKSENLILLFSFVVYGGEVLHMVGFDYIMEIAGSLIFLSW